MQDAGYEVAPPILLPPPYALERLIAPPNEGADAKFVDLLMLVEPGGRERTPAEFQALFAAAGFRLTRVTATTTALNVIEATPADGDVTAD